MTNMETWQKGPGMGIRNRCGPFCPFLQKKKGPGGLGSSAAILTNEMSNKHFIR